MLTVLGMFSSPKYGGNLPGFRMEAAGLCGSTRLCPAVRLLRRRVQGVCPLSNGKARLSGRKFKSGETVDFVVVGSGAAGGVMARELSRAGFTVLVFEQGPRLEAGDFEHDELKYFFLNGITNSPNTSPQTFRKLPSETARQPFGGFLPATYARIVGGSSTHYTANFWRFHEIDFNERSVLGGIPGTGFADWPISYQDLEPYYTKVEWEVGVSGLAYASPFDPPRSRPYRCRRCR